jgi:oligopeptide transport system permease protein
MILMMGLDVWLSLPAAVLAAIIGLLLSQLGDSLLVVSFVIGSSHWGRLARLVRGEVFRLREKSYIKAYESIGASSALILLDHIVPHLSLVLGVYIVYQVPSLILAESFLSFIGLGVQPPETSWGILLQDGWRSLQVYPHVVFYPAIFLFLTVLSLNSVFVRQSFNKANKG